MVPLPLPSLMFKNLARIWSSFSDTPIDAWEAAKWSEDAILVAGFPKGLRTVRLYEHTTTNKWIVGFTGTVRFAIEREKYNKELAKTAHALLKMAELTNVGVRRTAGLGMVRYIPPEDTAEEDGTA
ncbi:MAG: CRISPR system precrRNA processing endoribonuclease RAMP protein Cas6 [Candidatus Jordarchaeales archaeon]